MAAKQGKLIVNQAWDLKTFYVEFIYIASQHCWMWARHIMVECPHHDKGEEQKGNGQETTGIEACFFSRVSCSRGSSVLIAVALLQVTSLSKFLEAP